MHRGLALLASLALAACGGAQEARNMSREEVAAEQAQVRINPGAWEITTRITGVDAPDMPREMMQAMQGRRKSVRHCVTPEQANDPAAFSRSVQPPPGSCQVRGFSMRNGRMEGETICASGTPQEVRSRMSGRYGPDSFDYENRLATPAPVAGGTMNVSVRVEGRRIGDCPDTEAAGRG